MATSSLKSLPSVLRLISVLPSPFHCLIIASNQCQVSSKQHILNSRKDSLCTPMTNSTELYPTIGCIWPSLYFTDQLLAKQLTAAPHNKSPSSGILLWDLWASGCLFFPPLVSNLHTRFWRQCCVAKQCSIMASFFTWELHLSIHDSISGGFQCPVYRLHFLSAHSEPLHCKNLNYPCTFQFSKCKDR